MKKRKFDVGECSRIAIDHRSSEGIGDDLALHPKHKIFLSHSGAQKEFVEHLCQALEDHCHYPFFDKCPESLPKGKEFPSLIVKAVQQCRLLVVVVSEEYFMSKWPMIELNAFVQATKVLKSNVNATILPLFYGLSVSDFKDENRRQRWLEKWNTFAKDDPIEGRIKVEDWSFAVDELTKFTGLSYNQELKNVVPYKKEIVSHVCKLVPPDVKWDDSHVQGNVHEVLLDKIKKIGLSQKYNMKVVGIYGVGGIGKTTTCKILCNELSNEYEGRVCHVEYDTTCSNSKELLQNVVISLTRQSANFVHQLDEGECKDILHKNLFKQRTFLAMDNVWDNDNSIKQAKMFLKTPSHKDSLVVVTARSQSTLALLGIDGDACLEMPELGQADATKLFLYYAIDEELFSTKEDMRSIEWCVKKCYFCKGDGRGYHYHPLALEALGRQLGCYKEKPSEWVQLLSSVWKFNSFSGENVVFDVLRSSFVLLDPIEQALFMDLGFFLPRVRLHYSSELINWIGWKEQLCVVYMKDELKIQSQLDSLKRKGLLQDADLRSGRINMHDLYHEFVTLEAIGNFGTTTDMWDRKWMLVDGDDGGHLELEVTPSGGCWQKLSRLSIQQKEQGMFTHLRHGYQPPTNPITSLEGIKWQYFSNVLVLKLYELVSVHGRLNLKGMRCLRSLELYNLRCLERLEGLESLRHLTYFEWKISWTYSHIITTKTHIEGHFPTSLKYLYIENQCVLSGDDVLAHCHNLIKLKLQKVEVGVLLDLSNCLSLKSIEIYDTGSLKTLLGLSAIRSFRLEALVIQNTFRIHIPGLDQLNGLVRLDLTDFGFLWEETCLLSLTKLQVLTISTHYRPAQHCFPHELQELYYKEWTLYKAPCLNAFKQLQVLDFSYSPTLTQMDGMGDLRALRSLNLIGCKCLKKLPNLSTLRSLEELNLDSCEGLQLHEEDFEMLSKLPLLHPIHFSRGYECRRIRLDIVERKVLRYLGPAFYGPDSWLTWKEGTWEELELGLLPIEIGNRGIWDTYNLIESDIEELEDIESNMEDIEDDDFDLEDINSNIENV